jgi:hypothetical protein
LLFEAPPGSRGPGEDEFRFAHVGCWVEDLVGEWKRLQARGWNPVGDSSGGDCQPTGAVQLKSPYGLAVELVDVTIDRPRVADLYPRDSRFYRAYVVDSGLNDKAVAPGESEGS